MKWPKLIPTLFSMRQTYGQAEQKNLEGRPIQGNSYCSMLPQVGQNSIFYICKITIISINMKKYPLYFPHSGSNLCQMPESKEFEISTYYLYLTKSNYNTTKMTINGRSCIQYTQVSYTKVSRIIRLTNLIIFLMLNQRIELILPNELNYLQEGVSIWTFCIVVITFC